MELKIAPGTFLLSVPQLQDPNFMHTVVLVVEHSPEGAYGLVVNRTLDMRVDSLFPDHPVLAESSFPVYSGGPVGRDTLQFVHGLPQDIPGGVEITEGLFLGGEVDAMAAVVGSARATSADLRLFVGYSGWGSRQLEGELAIGSWVLAPPEPALVFDEQVQDAAWRRAMRSLGSEGEGLSHLPPDVSWN